MILLTLNSYCHSFPFFKEPISSVTFATAYFEWMSISSFIYSCHNNEAKKVNVKTINNGISFLPVSLLIEYWFCLITYCICRCGDYSPKAVVQYFIGAHIKPTCYLISKGTPV